MASCRVCGEDVDSVAFQCTGCQGLFCSDHRGAADHDCPTYDDRIDYDVVTPGSDAGASESDRGNEGSPTPSTGGPAVATDIGDTGDETPATPPGEVTPLCPDCGETITSMSDLEFTEMGAKMGVFRASKRFYAASCDACGRTLGTGVAGASGG